MKSRIFPALGKIQFENITVNTIEDFGAALLKHGLKPASVNAYDRILHKICNHAFRRGDRNVPALRAWPAQLEVEEIHQELSPEDTKSFLSAFDEAVIPGGAGEKAASDYYTALFRWAKPLFTCAIYLGLSRKDLLNLKWVDVDFAGGCVRTTRAKTKGKGNAKGKAIIPLSATAREALTLCRTRGMVSSEFVFLTRDGQRYSPTTFRRYFLIAKKHAKINHPFRPHDLRHTFGSLLRSSEVDLGVIQRAMGHSNSRMTERYARVSFNSMRSVAEALDKLQLLHGKELR